MKIGPKRSTGLSPRFVLLAVLWILGTTKVFAEIEIDLDEASKPTPVPAVKLTPTPGNAANKKPELIPTPMPVTAHPSPESQPTAVPTSEQEVDMEETAPTPGVVHGVEKMKDVYEAGIKSYQEKDYDQAIRTLKKAVSMKDKYTPKYYYAEAYATLGVIYQFHIIHYKTAYNYYNSALKYERRNTTARKHIKEVLKHRNKRHWD